MDVTFMPARLDIYTFRRARLADLAMLRGWLRRPHVRHWFGHPDPALAEIETHIRSTPNVVPFIVHRNEQPIGYIQSYDIHGEPAHPYADQPDGTLGIDMFLGEPEMLGEGHGPRMIDAFVRRLFHGGVPRIVIDPDPGNTRAIRAYLKAGFRVLGPRTSEYGDALLMARDHDCRTEPA